MPTIRVVEPSDGVQQSSDSDVTKSEDFEVQSPEARNGSERNTRGPRGTRRDGA